MQDEQRIIRMDLAQTGDYTTNVDCLVTDFGLIKLPNSWLLRLYRKRADEFRAEMGSKPAFVRYLMKDIKNPFEDELDTYFQYVNEMLEIGYVEASKTRWEVTFLAFHDWLRQKNNGGFAYKGREDQGTRREEKGDS